MIWTCPNSKSSLPPITCLFLALLDWTGSTLVTFTLPRQIFNSNFFLFLSIVSRTAAIAAALLPCPKKREIHTSKLAHDNSVDVAARGAKLNPTTRELPRNEQTNEPPGQPQVHHFCITPHKRIKEEQYQDKATNPSKKFLSPAGPMQNPNVAHHFAVWTAFESLLPQSASPYSYQTHEPAIASSCNHFISYWCQPATKLTPPNPPTYDVIY